MKYIIIWFVIQLVIIGGVSANMYAKMRNQTLDCSLKEYSVFKQTLTGIVFPLIFFLPDNEITRQVDNFCREQRGI